MTGQLNIFDFYHKINEKNKSLGEPCSYCEVEWCSLACFIKRGYIWDKVNRFAKDENGMKLRKSIENRECKKD